MIGSKSFSLATATQWATAAVVLAAVAWMPPAHGFMLLVPVLPSAQPAVIATRSDGLIIATGKFSGSILVFGDRSQILPAALANGILVIASGEGGCVGFKGTAP